MAIVVGLDPAFTNTGWAVIDTSREAVVEVGVVHTQKQTARQGTRVADDDVRRSAKIFRELCSVFERVEPVAVFAELPAGSRNARSNRALGLATGAIVGVIEARGLPCEWASQYQVKQACTGDGQASKAEVEAGVRDAWAWTGVELPGAKTRREHVFDAAGVVHALREGSLYRMTAKL